MNKEKNSIKNNSFTLDGKVILTEQCFYKISTKGRPRYKLNELGISIIEKLASFMCTEEEIASFLGVSVETLKRQENADAFADCLKKGREKGKASLRATQFKLAKSNPTMAIWLGKQYLGQKDIIEDDTTKQNESEALKQLCDAIREVSNK